ncbi:S16 family serine protease [Allostreptomyces psammosilenae]|uniref:PDZ domain-containing protein n=1 Tax=Allostreptomyces psammosilenae TaxID=1892865 RepID=A0A852ZV45_9ACTN|nr:S16 family serine protease [Allostreptomyces psammosilenae]NYI06246.1 PDZ domain-containing protein [Allostreptomyces psammosilenae]
MSWFSPRAGLLALSTVLVAALLAVAATVPLPYVLTLPGATADTLGEHDGTPLVSVSGVPTRETDGELRLTTIVGTLPDSTMRMTDIVDAWFDGSEAVMPRTALYGTSEDVQEIEQHNQEAMTESQSAAVTAALNWLGLSADEVSVELSLEDVGGPSAGLMFTLGIIDTIGQEGLPELAGGRVIAGTGTIAPDGTVGPVSGVPLKVLAADRDGAEVFLLPPAECGDAEATAPDGLRLVPVSSLDEAIDSLIALSSGTGSVPSC